MDSGVVYERDILYPTEGTFDPGSIHVELCSPKKGKIPVIIESKTRHSPVKYINDIISIMQGEIFERINVNARTTAEIYIRVNSEVEDEWCGNRFIKVELADGEVKFSGVDDID